MIQPTPLETARLRLRAFDVSDASALAAILVDPLIHANMLNMPNPYTPADARTFILFQDGLYAMIRKSDNVLLGCVLLEAEDYQRAQLAYLIGKPFRQQGYTVEAARRVVQFGFEEAGLQRIHAWCFTHNHASARLLERLGMTREAVFRENTLKDGAFISMAIYGLLREEWKSTP